MSDAGSICLTTTQVRQRYGGVSEMTIWRWRRDPELNFPQSKPIRKRHYWRVSDLDAWDQQRAAATSPPTSSVSQ